MRTKPLGKIRVFSNVLACKRKPTYSLPSACYLFYFFRLIMFYLFHEDHQFSMHENFEENENNADAVHGDCNSECDGGKAIYRISK